MAESSGGPAVKATIPLNYVQKAMAKSVKASTAEMALSQVSRELDMSALQRLRREKLNQAGPRISLNTLIMAAVARTLPAHPLLNAKLQDNQIIVYDPVYLGMAIAAPQGLVVVVIPRANQLKLSELAAAIEELRQRALAGRLELREIEGGTFTVSNLGMLGVDSGFPVPKPTESAILLFGAIRPRPVVANGQIEIRDTCWATLTFDHRFIDGATAAAFLEDLYQFLVAPEALLD
jgi:pyruvate dehydrogenase E2 component (dihydrolipoamide acetyltransferase)